MAQTTENGPKKEFRGLEREMQMKGGQRGGPFNTLNLTDVQKEAFKQSMMAIHKQLQPLQNEVGEALAHHKTLITAEKPDLDAVNKNIEKIGALRIEMAKIKAKHHLEMRAQLTDEQKFEFDLIIGKMFGEKGFQGMRHKKGMRFGHLQM